MKSKFLQLMVLAIALILSAKQSAAQTYSLGNLSSFVVFTGSGDINNYNQNSTKSSFVSGNLGTQSGTINTSQGVIGGTALSNTSLTLQAQTDLDTFQNRMVRRLDTSIIAPLTSGTTIITPGIYKYRSAGSISGSLTFNGLNHSSNKFIFIYEKGLTIAPATTMSLINGAYADNIFWIAEGGNISIGNTCTMLGNFVTNTGNITVDALGTMSGRLASISGIINVTTITASAPIAAPLPVKFASLTGQCDNNRMVIKFATASEQNNNYFTVQQSTDAQNWTAKSKIMSAGNSATLKNYSFTDSSASAYVSYYRIMQTDIDGSSLYSNVISVSSCGNANAISVSAYPNPSTGNFKVAYTGDRNQVSKTVVLDFNGKKVFEATGLRPAIDLTNKPSGMYMVQVIVNATIYSAKVMVQK